MDNFAANRRNIFQISSFPAVMKHVTYIDAEIKDICLNFINFDGG